MSYILCDTFLLTIRNTTIFLIFWNMDCILKMKIFFGYFLRFSFKILL